MESWKCMGWRRDCTTIINDKTEVLMGDLSMCSSCSDHMWNEAAEAAKKADERIAESEEDEEDFDF